MAGLAFTREHALAAFIGLTAVVLAACSGNTSADANNGGTGGVGGLGGMGGLGSGGGLSQAVCDQAAAFAPINPTALLDDMEDGNGLIAQVADRSGSWWISTDGTAGTIQPAADQAPTPETIVGGRCESKKAVRVTGQGFTGWGAVLSAGMAYSTHPEPSDLSGFTGLMFWARIGEQNTSSIRVQFQDSHTEPNGGECVDEPGNPEACYDGFGTEVIPISTRWQLYKIKFAEMKQRGFGHRGEALDTAHIYDVEFNLDPNSVIDLWVDDLWFFE
ncbi:MAG: hypothetical protein ACOY0T_08215 [Myxococcota bacterium]